MQPVARAMSRKPEIRALKPFPLGRQFMPLLPTHIGIFIFIYIYFPSFIFMIFHHIPLWFSIVYLYDFPSFAFIFYHYSLDTSEAQNDPLWTEQSTGPLIFELCRLLFRTELCRNHVCLSPKDERGPGSPLPGCTCRHLGLWKCSVKLYHNDHHSKQALQLKPPQMLTCYWWHIILGLKQLPILIHYGTNPWSEPNSSFCLSNLTLLTSVVWLILDV